MLVQAAGGLYAPATECKSVTQGSKVEVSFAQLTGQFLQKHNLQNTIKITLLQTDLELVWNVLLKELFKI